MHKYIHKAVSPSMYIVFVLEISLRVKRQSAEVTPHLN